MTIEASVAHGRTRLTEAGLRSDQARIDAEVLARHALGWNRATYIAERHRPGGGEFERRYAALIARRAGREPVAHLTGSREFWGIELAVTPDVLIPRPETELIVEAVLGRRARHPPALRIADVGTGSGCLAVVLAVELPAARILATDLSAAALAVARRNAARHGVEDRIDWRVGRGLAGATPPIDLIVSNPPYVPSDVIPTLEPEVRDHEPRLALDGGADGTVALRAIAAEAATALTDGGDLIVEFGADQEDAFRRIAAAASLQIVEIVRDLQGLPRVGIVTRRRT